MKVFHNTQEAKGNLKNTVVTTGSFDGVHIGHKMIIERLQQLAGEIQGESTLVTFHPHPRKVLYPEQKDLRLINSQEEKIQLLAKTGLDNLVILPFSVEFSKTSSHDFITKILLDQLNARVIVVGQNHHFGHNRAGDFSYLYKLGEETGFKVEDIPLKDIENETVSSTKIRKALAEGNIMRANAYLDHQYIITGPLAPTPEGYANLPGKYHRLIIEEEEKLIPPPGVYASNMMHGNNLLKSMTVISDDDKGIRNVDSALLFDNAPANNERVTLYFYKKILGQEAFWDGSIDMQELRDAREDVEELIY